jgi:hypothetical protein
MQPTPKFRNFGEVYLVTWRCSKGTETAVLGQRQEHDEARRLCFQLENTYKCTRSIQIQMMKKTNQQLTAGVAHPPVLVACIALDPDSLALN